MYITKSKFHLEHFYKLLATPYILRKVHINNKYTLSVLYVPITMYITMINSVVHPVYFQSSTWHDGMKSLSEI